MCCFRFDTECDDNPQLLVILNVRALDSEVMDAVYAAVEARLPDGENNQPLGCHNPRIADRVCFEGILTRLVTGCFCQTAERILGGRVSDTTVRARRDGWIAAGVFDGLVTEATEAYDRVVGLDRTEAAIDGSLHKAPCGGPGTGRTPPTGEGRTENGLFDRAQQHSGQLGHRRRQLPRHHSVRAHRGCCFPERSVGSLDQQHESRNGVAL